MLTCILSLQGITGSMMRDAGWHMIEAGRWLERGLQLCHLLAATAVERRAYRTDRDVLDTLLTAAESIVTHRRRYRGSVRVADALELLLLDRDNPRSLAFALSELRQHLAAMPASTGSTRPERLLEHLEAFLAETDVYELTTTNDVRRRGLESFLADMIGQLEQLGEAVDQQHFEAGPPPVPLSALALVEEIEASA
jgi:uncharacterized alpha-E superfamily protein